MPVTQIAIGRRTRAFAFHPLLLIFILSFGFIACSKRGSASLDEARLALDDGNYAKAKTLAFDSNNSEKYQFINLIDERQKKAETELADIKYTVSHAYDDGRENTTSRLESIRKSTLDRNVRNEADKALKQLDTIYANAPKPPPVNPNVPRQGVMEPPDPKPAKRYIDEKPPEDSLKKKQALAPSPKVKDAIEFAAFELSRGHFQQAVEVLTMSGNEISPHERDFLRERIEEINYAASRELAALVTAADSAIGSNEEALEKLYSRLDDFPPGAMSAELKTNLESVLLGYGRARDLSLTDVVNRNPRTIPTNPPEPNLINNNYLAEPAVEELFGQADTAFSAGEFTAAAELYERAFKAAVSETAKIEAKIRTVESSRIASFIVKLQNALAAAPVSDFNPGTARRGKLLTGTGRGVVLETAAGVETIEWNAISSAAWKVILDKAGSLVLDEKLGVATLLAKAKIIKESDKLLKEAVDEQPAIAADVNRVLARRSGIDVPAYGFVWFNEKWVTFKERETYKLAEKIKSTLERIEIARTARERDQFTEELVKLGEEAADAFAIAIKEKRAELTKRLHGLGFARKLEPLRAELVKLQSARKHALDLIFDEVKYFYPYRVPECPPEKAKFYPGVQAEVAKRVKAVEEVWNSELSIALGSAAAPLKALHEIEARRISMRIFDIDDNDETELYLSLDPSVSELTVRNLFASQAERKNIHDYNRRIVLFNAMVKSGMTKEEELCAQYTNQYREMFGRKLLAYNDKLTRASQKHSKWMSDVGQVSHFQTDPKTRTPFDRMRLEDYLKGISENCAFASGAGGAFMGWAHSSGHHRNMLMPGHTEFGIGVSAQYWTQNFGIGDEYKQNEAWRQ
ncbi:MAG: CAP domain-containing protein [Planctomycetota bacterium]